MGVDILFVGYKFISNNSLREYVLREILKSNDAIESIQFIKENDNKLFLHLQQELSKKQQLFVITTKSVFPTIGKLLCTITGDIQTLKEGVLIPQKSTLFEQGSYLLEFEGSSVNVLHVDEMQKMPPVLLQKEQNKAIVHVFEEEKDSLEALLFPVAQMYDVAFYVTTLIEGWQRVDVVSKKYGNISNFLLSIKQLLSSKMIASSNVMGYIIDTLSREGKTISFAESCTGGLLSYFLTKNNGSSKILEGSLVTYSNRLKENWLAVDKGVLEEYGAVSAEVVMQMSDGAMNVANADYTISISGIAGEGGGSEQKPVGTVYVGVRTKEVHKEVRLFLQGDRNYIQYQSVLYAIKMLLLIDKPTFFAKK